MDYSLQRYTEEDFQIVNRVFVFGNIAKNYKIAIYTGSALRLINTAKFKFNII